MKNQISKIKNRQTRRKIRVRVKVQGTKVRPRLSVFRSNKYIYAQLIDDFEKKTLIGISEKEMEGKSAKKMSKQERAKQLGMYLGQKAKEQKIKRAIFDRGEYAYKGRIKALAEGAREGGLEF